ncbi:MAG: PRC-barrel domain-containing protein [Chloroflexia bacterium]
MKFSELKGRAVVSLDDAKKIGDVEDIMVDPVGRHIVGLKVRTGVFSASEFVRAAEVKNIGADAVTVSANANSAPVPAESAESPIGLTSILGNKVVTDTGTLVGELRDVLIDWTNLTITGYEAGESGLFAKVRAFTATPDVRFGDKIITLPAELLSQPG